MQLNHRQESQWAHGIILASAHVSQGMRNAAL